MHTISRHLYKFFIEGRNHIETSSFTKLKNITSENSTLRSTTKYFCSSTTNSTGCTHDKILKEVSKGDEEVEYKLKVLHMEMELLRQEGELVPEIDQLKEKHYIELLKLKHRNGRKRYLEYVFKLFKKKENDMRKKKEKALQFEERRKTMPAKDVPFEQFVQLYDLVHNCMFLRIQDKSMNNLYNSKLIKAMQFGQKLVFDCGFHDKMTDRENSNCAKQLMFVFGDNRIHEDPYDIHFCNYDKSSSLASHLHKCINTLYDAEFPLNIHSKSYLDLFPKDKLIYLTPHCREEMREYDHDAIYIVGAIVDKVNQTPWSLAKAKEQNIKMQKFPLDRYLSWSSGGGKSLTLNQVISILLDMKQTGDWKYALRHVPQRKLVRDEEIMKDITKNLMKMKKRWTPENNLDNLSYKFDKGKARSNDQEFKRQKRQVSVTSLFQKQ